MDASVFHVTPEEIKSYIKVDNSEQRIIKKETSDDGGTYVRAVVILLHVS